MTIEGDRMPKVKSSMKHKGRQAASTADAAGGARQGMVFNTGDFFSQSLSLRKMDIFGANLQRQKRH